MRAQPDDWAHIFRTGRSRPGRHVAPGHSGQRGKANFLCKECSQRFIYDVVIILLPLESLLQQLLLGSVLISINRRILLQCRGLVCSSVWAPLPASWDNALWARKGRDLPSCEERGLTDPLSAIVSLTRFPKQRRSQTPEARCLTAGRVPGWLSS